MTDPAVQPPPAEAWRATADGAPITRIGAYVVCLDDAERILLCRISEPIPDNGRWTLPGGGLEFGEAPEAAAHREFEEETGLVAELDGVADTFSIVIPRSVPFGGGPLHFLGIVYRGRAAGGALRDEVDGTTDACAWYGEAEARSLPLNDLARTGIELAFGPPER